ncbi:PCID2 [Cordylochernes scorpioides]|uniref:PCID2 n=1 Tax=Cordylochernes scorpioides TaxID=51811 RepID=A0ABY6K4T1_9ARAC|nr:PCID2 [Cordylochernes scorpioides]
MLQWPQILAKAQPHQFHVGKKFMFDSDFKNAEECLSFAFQRCHKDFKKNKRLILTYLIPVKMLLGHMPTHQLLRKYNLLQFENVLIAVKQGNLLKLNEALEKEEQFLLKRGIFLILEKLKINTYRNLFKKIYLMVKSHQIHIEAFYAILKTMKGKIKGYISYQHNKLVVSKQNPFPPLSTVSLSGPLLQ